MATVSHFEQIILCDTQAEYDAALLQLQSYSPSPGDVALLTINEFSSESPKRLVAVFDNQSVVL